MDAPACPRPVVNAEITRSPFTTVTPAEGFAGLQVAASRLPADHRPNRQPKMPASRGRWQRRLRAAHSALAAGTTPRDILGGLMSTAASDAAAAEEDQAKAVLKVLGGHRSIRKFQAGKDVSEETLELVLATAAAASSSGNMQTWSVVVSRDEAARRKLWELHGKQGFILEAPVTLTFCSDWHRMVRWARLRDANPGYDNMLAWITGQQDAVIAAQNAAVALEALGLGICYMGTTLWAMDEIGAALDLPEGVVPATSMVVGWPAEEPALRDRLPLADTAGSSGIVHRERYRSPSDAELLDFYKEREQAGWARYASNGEPGAWEAKMAEAGVHNLAQFYTSEFKYSAARFERISDEVIGPEFSRHLHMPRTAPVYADADAEED